MLQNNYYRIIYLAIYYMEVAALFYMQSSHNRLSKTNVVQALSTFLNSTEKIMIKFYFQLSTPH